MHMTKRHKNLAAICFLTLIILFIQENFFSNNTEALKGCDHGCDLKSIQNTYYYLELTHSALIVVVILFLSILVYGAFKHIRK
ncbi:MAG: hypothetical protein C0490_15965 [Marivirga sp.]|nr:hypothetical protein [Marivirga sp.]